MTDDNNERSGPRVRSQTGPFAMVPRWVQRHPDVKPYELAVYVSLTQIADWDTGSTDRQRPGMSQIAEWTGMSRRRVVTAVRTLESLGMIVVTRERHDDGSRKVNVYTVVQVEPCAHDARGGGAHGALGVVHDVHGGSEPRAQVLPEQSQQSEQEQGASPDGDATDDVDVDDTFELFWAQYPPTNDVKRDKQGALREWRKLTLDERRRAYRGAKNKRAHFEATEEQPPYALRFLRRRDFDDYQHPIRVDKATGTAIIDTPAPTTCPHCGAPYARHDDRACPNTPYYDADYTPTSKDNP